MHTPGNFIIQFSLIEGSNFSRIRVLAVYSCPLVIIINLIVLNRGSNFSHHTGQNHARPLGIVAGKALPSLMTAKMTQEGVGQDKTKTARISACSDVMLPSLSREGPVLKEMGA